MQTRVLATYVDGTRCVYDQPQRSADSVGRLSDDTDPAHAASPAAAPSPSVLAADGWLGAAGSPATDPGPTRWPGTGSASYVPRPGGPAGPRRPGRRASRRPGPPPRRQAGRHPGPAGVGSLHHRRQLRRQAETHVDPDGARDGWVPDRPTAGRPCSASRSGPPTWFPSNNTPRDKATYTVRVDRAVGARGGRQRRPGAAGRQHGASTTWTWSQPPADGHLPGDGLDRDYHVYHSTMRTTTGSAAAGLELHRPHAAARLATSGPWSPGRSASRSAAFGPLPVRPAPASWSTDDRRAATRWRPRTGRSSTALPDDLTHRARAGPPVVRRLGHPAGLGGHLAQRGLRELRRGPVGGRARRSDAPQQRSSSATTTNHASSSLWTPGAGRFTDPADLFGDPVYTRGGMTLQALREQDRLPATSSRILRRWAAHRARRLGDAPRSSSRWPSRCRGPGPRAVLPTPGSTSPPGPPATDDVRPPRSTDRPTVETEARTDRT